MIEKPGIELVASPAAEWAADGPLAGRALAYARRFAKAVPDWYPNLSNPAQNLSIVASPPEHAGFGAGTQLGLAVAQALATAWQLPRTPARDLAQYVGRGRRSALGVHGFDLGGLLVEGGKDSFEALSPLLVHNYFPLGWRVVVALPSHAAGTAGSQEAQAFEVLERSGVSLAQTDALCRLILLGMLPALAKHDLPAFGEALYDYNRRAGAMFAPVQGGVYANPQSAAIIQFLRDQGVRGVGQSSWGPAVFAVVGTQTEAERWTEELRSRFGMSAEDVWWTGAANHGATVEIV
jgi:beta-RFAP synthase